MSKNILVLPGTQWQVPLIEKIQEMGHRALVVNPDPQASGMKKADLFLISDIFDKDRVIEFGREQKINAVMSDECDIAMNWVAELGSIFNVPTLDEEAALKVVAALNAENIFPRRYFYPSVNTFKKLVPYVPMPKSEDIASRILCLPLHVRMTMRDIEEIAQMTLKASK